MDIKLISDFRDYYDHMFATNGIEFIRNARDCTRMQALSTLERMGLQVPRWGTVAGIAAAHPAVNEIVVYTDEYAHRGEGKLWTTVEDALRLGFGDSCAILFVLCKPQSLRYLRIGHNVFYLTYYSDDAWRSNCGNVTIEWCPPPNFLRNFIDKAACPMLAIDFIVSEHGLWGAVDYNTSPGLRHTPIEERYSATHIIAMLEEWYNAQYSATNQPR